MRYERNSVSRRLFNALKHIFSFLICEQKTLARASAYVKAVNTVFDIEFNKILNRIVFDAAVLIKRGEQSRKQALEFLQICHFTSPVYYKNYFFQKRFQSAL